MELEDMYDQIFNYRKIKRERRKLEGNKKFQVLLKNGSGLDLRELYIFIWWSFKML